MRRCQYPRLVFGGFRSHESGHRPNARKQLAVRATLEKIRKSRMKRNYTRLVTTIERVLELKVYRRFPPTAIASHQKVENE